MRVCVCVRARGDDRGKMVREWRKWERNEERWRESLRVRDLREGWKDGRESECDRERRRRMKREGNRLLLMSMHWRQKNYMFTFSFFTMGDCERISYRQRE